MRSRFLPLVVPLIMLCAGCEILSTPSDNGDSPLTELPRALTAAERSLIAGSNGFAFGFLREVDAVEEDPNVFVSPLSASMALGMAMNGAAGETQAEMRETLGYGNMAIDDANASYRSLIDLLLGLDPNVEMQIANALWLREGVEFRESFLTATRDHFEATAEVLDFDDPSSVDVINAWVDRNTNGRIESILDEIARDAVLYLMNAIYFKGDWTTQFDPDDTRPMPFHRADGGQHEVSMMHLSAAPVLHFSSEEAAVLDIPYGREAFSMTIVLPGDGRTLEELVAALDESQWNDWIASLRETELDVFLPRFRLQYERSLNGPLKALGMQRAFDPQAADFSALSPMGEQMYISEVKQKSFLDVNEEGTEAAAVTSVEIRVTSAPPSFVVDRPFLMVIRERLTGTILFMGAIGAPESP